MKDIVRWTVFVIGIGIAAVAIKTAIFLPGIVADADRVAARPLR